MRLGELIELLAVVGYHDVWTRRRANESWADIVDDLGIDEDTARSWFLQWSNEQEARYVAARPVGMVTVTFAGDRVSIEAHDLQQTR